MVCFLVKSLFIDSVVKNHGSQIRAKQKISGRLKKYFRPKFADVPILSFFFQDRRKYRVAMPAERLPIHFRFMLLSLSIFVFTVISVPMM